jgi:Ca2+/H+ antiporter
MLEISVFCVILLAAAYWVVMFVMGRHDDVIHGKFVHADEQGGPSAMPAPPPFPKRPVKAVPLAHVQHVKVQPAKADAKPVNSAALQSLLAAIQQDLKSVA